MRAIWRLQLLGGLVLTRLGELDSTSRVRLPATRTGALLSRLALPVAGRTYRRDELAEALWPDEPEAPGRHRLRQLLVDLRRLLGPDSGLSTDRDSVCLESAAWETDVADFLHCVKAAEIAARTNDLPERMASLNRSIVFYQGDLLPSFADTWISRERDHLRAAFLDSLRMLAVCAEDDNDNATALSAARRLMSEEPIDEGASLLLLRLLASAGQPGGARREYERLRKAAQRAGIGLAKPFRLEARQAMRTAASVASARAEKPSTPAANTGDAAVAANLPAFFTRFFGRETEIERISVLLFDPHVRLLSLVGPGGLGKTRLSVEAASSSKRSVCFVGLAALPATAGLPEIAAQLSAALGLHPSANGGGGQTSGAALDAVTSALRSRQPMLLILDNIEHLLRSGAAPAAVHRLLTQAPHLTILATSRLPLGVSGETVFPVHPLPVAGNSVGVHDTDSNAPVAPGIALFVDRVRAVRPDFLMTAHNAAAIEMLCRNLDGMPLALEIAAGWARTLTVAQMLERLDRRFAFLVRQNSQNGSRTDAVPNPDGAPPERHRSLETVVAWSYDMLPPETARFFRRLAVFHGGWTAAAAAAVAGNGNAEAADAHLQLLCEHNLIVAEPPLHNLPEMRFTMLETLRDFAAERLTQEERSDAVRQHLAYFTELAWTGDEWLKGADHWEWLDRLTLEKANFRAAFAREGQVNGDDVLTARLAASLMEFWLVADVWEAMRWLKAALKIPGVPPEVRARLLTGWGRVAIPYGDQRSGKLANYEAQQLFQQVGDENGLSDLLARSGNSDAFATAIVLCSQPGRERLLAWAYYFQATNAAYRESHEEAARGFAKARRLFDECEDSRNVAGVGFEEAFHQARWGAISKSAEQLEDVLRVFGSVGRRHNVVFTTEYRLGNLRRLQGCWNSAREHLRSAEHHVRRGGWQPFLGEVC